MAVTVMFPVVAIPNLESGGDGGCLDVVDHSEATSGVRIVGPE